MRKKDETIAAIDDAIFTTDENIHYHKKRAFLMLAITLTVLSLFLTLIYFVFQNQYSLSNDIKKLDNQMSLFSKLKSIQDSADITKKVSLLVAESKEDIDKLTLSLTSEVNKFTTMHYYLFAVFVLIFGVTISFYRYHLKEIAKYENFLLGFHRIRIAGDHTSEGYQTEVRQALTQDAFVMETKSITTKKRVESPLPGYPSSDLSVFLLNKILDAVDIDIKKRDSSKTEQ